MYQVETTLFIKKWSDTTCLLKGDGLLQILSIFSVKIATNGVILSWFSPGIGIRLSEEPFCLCYTFKGIQIQNFGINLKWIDYSSHRARLICWSVFIQLNLINVKIVNCSNFDIPNLSFYFKNILGSLNTMEVTQAYLYLWEGLITVFSTACPNL